MEFFFRSCEDYLGYPKNLTFHHQSRHTLVAYHERLNFQLYNRLHPFCDENKAAVIFWDLSNEETEYRSSCVDSLDSMKVHLRQALLPQSRDPDCRYIFLEAPHARAPILITPSMLKFLFSYHQVMPSFLDFLFSFGKQVSPQASYFSGLREDSGFTPWTDHEGLADLGRSYSELRLCYNLRSVERFRDDPLLPWAIRQSAVYHRFDTKTGIALWIVVKGNTSIKTRMMDATEVNVRSRPSNRVEMFSETLRAHSIMCYWSGENWSWYINDVENQLQLLAKPVYTVLAEKKPGYTQEHVASEEWGSLRNPPQVSEKDGEEPEKIISLRDVHHVQYIEEKARESHLLIGFNIQILDDLREHYKVVVDSAQFPEELRRECQGDLWRFDRCVLGVRKDLGMVQSRTEGLLDRLVNHKNLLNSMIQHQGVRTSAGSAQKAQQSADNMEKMTKEMHEIAKRTKQETVSMRAVTTVTLFFLPATFIATFMSTDILKFEDGKKDFQVDGLKIYLAVALPLTVLTFVAWYIIYYAAKRQEIRNGSTSRQGMV